MSDPENQIYNVESIVDKKKVGHLTKYLVKWQGYPNSENTWVIPNLPGTS
jgi:hypothetical protein